MDAKMISFQDVSKIKMLYQLCYDYVTKCDDFNQKPWTIK